MNKRIIQGFTLIELLIVISVLGILATVVFVSLNPLARFQDTRNARRQTDVLAIMDAIKLEQLGNGGVYGTSVNALTPDSYYQIGTGDNCSEECFNPRFFTQSDCIDFSGLVEKGHLPKVPIDPKADGASEEHTKYYIVKNSNGTLTIGACHEELGSNEIEPEISDTK